MIHYNTKITPYRAKLLELHGSLDALVIRAPGRINLIGEHTDYNGGLALPAAIDRYLFISVSKRKDDMISTRADGFQDAEINLNELSPAHGEWHTYIQGVVAALIGRDNRLTGFTIHVCGDIPAGAGLSSSAALCCGTALALNELFGLQLSLPELALIAQEAEHRFAGVQCGLMDQYACLFGKRGYALLLDFQDMSHQYIRLNLEDLDLVLLDTGVKHSLASTEYNLRKQECQLALQLIQNKYPNVQSLREVDMDQLYDAVLVDEPTAFKRVRYFLEENKRVATVTVALGRRMLALVGEILYESHRGLQHLYGVSCRELDLLVGLAQKEKSVTGARMMGGGFGGCTINLVEKKNKACLGRIAQKYEAATGRAPGIHRLMTADGARVLNQREILHINLNVENTSATLPKNAGIAL